MDEYKNGRNVFTNGNPIEFSVEGINNIIARFGYREYNGIRCYALEDKGDTWLVGMNYGEVLGLFVSKMKWLSQNLRIPLNTVQLNEKLRLT